MKKEIVPVVIVLALVVVGVGSYFFGQRSNEPAIENPPAQSSAPEATPEATPDATPAETTPPEPTPEVSAEPEVSEEPTPEVNVEPDPEKEPVVTPEPSVEPEPVATSAPEPTPTPSSSAAPVYDLAAQELPEGMTLDDFYLDARVRKEAEQALKETTGKFTYPENYTLVGLTANQISKGYYIDKATGDILDQEGRYHGQYGGWAPEDAGIDTEEEIAALKANEENAAKIYNGDGSGSNTSGFNG